MAMPEPSQRYCGRVFSAAELDQIRAIIAADDQPNRAEIARRVCRQLSWYRPNGDLKAMSCRVVLLKMHRDELVQLPAPGNSNGNGRIPRHVEPGEPLPAARVIPYFRSAPAAISVGPASEANTPRIAVPARSP